MPDFNDSILKKVAYQEHPQFEVGGMFDGIKAITYDGANIGDKKTKVFAYMGFPKDRNEKVPAVVLVHGGGGVAYVKWVKMWNDRGYAAIAMSTTGDFPKILSDEERLKGSFEEGEANKLFQHGLYGIFLEEGYVDAPLNDEMQNSSAPLDEQWMYHAIHQVIYAHNILRADERVDSEKIGITGISWGGVITSLVIGYDNRFAFAIPVYGSGYMNEGLGYVCRKFDGEDTKKLWLAEKRFLKVKMPVLWQCWNSDMPFSINSNSHCYLDTVKNNADTRFSAVHEMKHSHEHGWVRKEAFLFADSVCKTAKKLPDITKDGEILNPDQVKIVSKRLFYITEKLTYSIKGTETRTTPDQQWHIADYNGEIPKNAYAYYIELCSEIDGVEYVSCSPYTERI